jgi:hypothetical protein
LGFLFGFATVANGGATASVFDGALQVCGATNLCRWMMVFLRFTVVAAEQLGWLQQGRGRDRVRISGTARHGQNLASDDRGGR